MIFSHIICVGVSLFLIFGGTECTYCIQCTSFYSMYCEDLWDMRKPILPTNCTEASSYQIIDNLIMSYQEGDDEYLSAEEDLLPEQRVARSARAAVLSGLQALLRDLNNTQDMYPGQEVAKRRTKREEDDEWDCFKVNLKGQKGRRETFRGCVPLEDEMNLCSYLYPYNKKAHAVFDFCETCTNRKGKLMYPDDKNSKPPCNHAVGHFKVMGAAILLGSAALLVISK